MRRMRSRTITFRVRLETDDFKRPGMNSLRDCLLERIYLAIVEREFKVGSGEYAVTIERKGWDGIAPPKTPLDE